MGLLEENREINIILFYGIKAAYCQHGLSTAGDRDPRLGIIASQLSAGCARVPTSHRVFWMEVIDQPSFKEIDAILCFSKDLY